METKQLGPRLRVDLVDALKEYSDDTRRSVVSVIEEACREYLERRGKEVKNANDLRN